MKTFLVLACRRTKWPRGQVMELSREFEAETEDDARKAMRQCIEKIWEEMADKGRLLPIPARDRFFSMLESEKANTEIISATEVK